MSVIEHEYMKFWDYEKNIISPNDVTKGSGKEVWWTCPNGHSFKRDIKRTLNISQESKVCNECNTFAFLNPELEEFYNHELSETPFNKLPPSINRKKNYFICDRGHDVNIFELKSLKTKDYINSHCKECNKIDYSFSFQFPDRLEWWNYETNTLNPDEVKLNDNVKAWFTCDKGHEFYRNPFAKITSDSFCPDCSHPFISFKEKYPEIVDEYWDYKNNTKLPEEFEYATNTLLYFKCSEGHEFTRNATIFRKLKDRELCKECREYRNSIKIKHPKIAKFYDSSKNNKTVDNAPATLRNKYWWKCEAEGHEFRARLNTMVKSNGCYYCNRSNFSFSEKELQVFIENNYGGGLIYNDRKILEGKELDIYILKLKKAIEFNGDYWHCNKVIYKKSNNKITATDYHTLKYKKCKDNNIDLVFVWEHDWLEHKKIVETELLKFLNNEDYNNELFSKFESIMDTGECIYCDSTDDYVENEFDTKIEEKIFKKPQDASTDHFNFDENNPTDAFGNPTLF